MLLVLLYGNHPFHIKSKNANGTFFCARKTKYGSLIEPILWYEFQGSLEFLRVSLIKNRRLRTDTLLFLVSTHLVY